MPPVDRYAPALLYALPLLLAWLAWTRGRARWERRSLAMLHSAREAGLCEPVSLHPAIDPDRCLGCGSCARACPEPEVLGLIGGKARLVKPADCIGHGACREACPTDAITLVLGTETRGVDVPVLTPEFETNVPGLFVAGELGGMGLIRNAIEQGRQAVESVRRRGGIGSGDGLDLLIVGAGPAGFAASLAAMKHGLRFVTLEREELGGSVAHYPRGKIVMTSPAELPLVGKVKLRETTKEALIAFWKDVERRTGVRIRYREGVETIVRHEGGFRVRSTRGSYEARAVLLAIGRRGTPQKLGVPGEELPKVVYRLVDPEQYRAKRVLVVGGGDSALEAAASLAEEPGTDVVLSYRRGSFDRAKVANRARVEAAARGGRLRLALASQVDEILPAQVRLRKQDRVAALDNDAVLICAGGVLPSEFLRSAGVALETRHGTA